MLKVTKEIYKLMYLTQYSKALIYFLQKVASIAITVHDDAKSVKFCKSYEIRCNIMGGGLLTSPLLFRIYFTGKSQKASLKNNFE